MHQVGDLFELYDDARTYTPYIEINIYFFVVQRPPHKCLFAPVKNNEQGHLFIAAVKFLLSGNRQEQKSSCNELNEACREFIPLLTSL